MMPIANSEEGWADSEQRHQQQPPPCRIDGFLSHISKGKDANDTQKERTYRQQGIYNTA